MGDLHSHIIKSQLIRTFRDSSELMNNGGALATTHPPRLLGGAGVHNGSSKEVGGMSCFKTNP
jgi:hypothetical protein